jgi:hypothetical protein
MYQEGKPSTMTAERLRAFDGVGFSRGRSKADFSSIWSVRLQQMREFKVEFGHCFVPLKYLVNPKLGPWVLVQRRNCRLYQEGKPSRMTAERIRELECLEFKWEQTYINWNERFEQLREFKVQFGHCVVPLNYSPIPKLRQWASKQRSNYRLYQEGKPSTMTAGAFESSRVLVSNGSEVLLLGANNQLCKCKVHCKYCTRTENQVT